MDAFLTQISFLIRKGVGGRIFQILQHEICMKIITRENRIEELEYIPFKTEKKIDYEFQQMGIELEPFYGKVIWSLFYKYPLEKIRDAHKVCVERGVMKLAYLIGVIKNLK